MEHWAQPSGLSQVAAFIDFREHQIKHPTEAAAFLNQFGEADLGEFESTASEKIHNLVFAYLAPGEQLTLSSLREALEFAEQDEDECRYLATLLSPFCRGVNHGDFLDGASTVSLNGPVVHFELGLLPRSAKEFAPIIGFLAINSMRQHVLSLPRHLRKRIVIEEISYFLDVPGGVEMLRELLEQFRKYNVQVIYTGQQYSRFADTPLRAALIGNTSAWFIFNTGDAQDIERLGQALGLSRVACETIKKFPRPDQLTGPNRYSEFLYVHTAPRSPIVGPVRHVLLPHEVSAAPVDLSLPPPNQ